MSKSIPNNTRNDNFSDTANTVTVLTCTARNFAAKTHRRAADGNLFTEGFNAGKYFKHEQVSFDDLRALYEVITEAAANPKKLVIRGRLRADAPQRSDGRARRCNLKQADGEEPYFEDADRTWAMFDFDKVENPDGLRPASIEAMEYLRTLLPPEFHGVECIYSLSASAGLSDSDRISGHLWFVFNRPVSNHELKTWLSGYPVDKRLFQCVQAHYIASPLFRDGIVDPIDERNGLLPGAPDVVSVPEIDISRPVNGHRGDGGGLEGAVGYEARMALLGDGEGTEGCHGVITPAIAAYMSRHGPQADREALKADIRQRAACAPWDRAAHSEDYVASEISDETLDRSIQDWVDKTFTQSDGYQASELSDVGSARKQVEQSVGSFVAAASKWQSQHDYRQSLIKQGSIGFFKIDKHWVNEMWPPPRHGLAALVGLGKTEAYIQQLKYLLPLLRRGHCVFIGVSNHDLSRELQQRLREIGIESEVYLGPTQSDPDQADKKMCWVSDWLEVFQQTDSGNNLCKVCPHSHECGFQKQRLKKSQIWIGAHQIIYRKRRKPISSVDFVIIDEDPLSAGLEGDNLKKPLWLPCKDVPNDVQKAIEQLPLGQPFHRGDFAVTDRRLHELIRQSLSRIEKVELSSSVSEQEIRYAVAVVQANRKLLDIAGFYRTIANEGPWGMRPLKLSEGTIGLRWVRQRKIHPDFDVPTLFADATLNADMIERIIDVERPPADVEEAWIDEDGSIVPALDQRQPVIMGPVAKIAAKTPHATYRQVLFSGAAALFKDGPTGTNNLGRVRRYIEGRSALFPRVLVICQLDLEQKLRVLGLPPSVETAHFNSIRGQDKWKDVDLLIVIGRTQPPPNAMELQAEALFRTSIRTLGPDYYDSTWMPLTGTATAVPVERHPDPNAETVRWHKCEAEIIQAIGRVRAVNRTSKNPVQVDIINQIPLPGLEIDEVAEWEDAHPAPGVIIAGRYGLLLAGEGAKGTSNVIAALLPDLFGTANAAKKAKVYSRCQTPNRYYLLGKAHREYTPGPKPSSAPLIALKAPGCRFAVLGHAQRPATRRPVELGEMPPRDADVDEEGVLTYGPVYVLKNIPRRLKPKQV
ncbi:MAG: hypothetical protein HN491_12265 [Rhodospirillales bacterium]|nr:hypothetical protein [Rhodospirillales bacterium]